jgi:glutamine cyclotransferase
LKALRYFSVVALSGLAACGQPAGSQMPEIIRVLPHDPGASTQGLLLYGDVFYESTGQYGSSSVRQVDVGTGEVLRSIEINPDYFGEGLARVGNELIMLTWKENRAFVFNMVSLDLVREIEYEGEGWGLCYDGESLFMSNGSAILHRRDPSSFGILESFEVTLRGAPVRNLNELECVGDSVYANVFQTDRILRIDKASGEVLEEFDASSLEPAGGRPPNARAVLNGIAYNPRTDTFFLTGKLWPSIFEVRLSRE